MPGRTNFDGSFESRGTGPEFQCPGSFGTTQVPWPTPHRCPPTCDWVSSPGGSRHSVGRRAWCRGPRPEGRGVSSQRPPCPVGYSPVTRRSWSDLDRPRRLPGPRWCMGRQGGGSTGRVVPESSVEGGDPRAGSRVPQLTTTSILPGTDTGPRCLPLSVSGPVASNRGPLMSGNLVPHPGRRVVDATGTETLRANGPLVGSTVGRESRGVPGDPSTRVPSPASVPVVSRLTSPV